MLRGFGAFGVVLMALIVVFGLLLWFLFIFYWGGGGVGGVCFLRKLTGS